MNIVMYFIGVSGFDTLPQFGVSTLIYTLVFIIFDIIWVYGFKALGKILKAVYKLFD